MLPKVRNLQKKYDDLKVECDRKDATNHSLVKELQKLKTNFIKPHSENDDLSIVANLNWQKLTHEANINKSLC